MMEKKELPVMSFESQGAWETWLGENHLTSPGVWLKFFKKKSGVKGLVYKEALDVALCYGWIDSQIKGFDEAAYLQRFTPRGAKSIWSQINIEHVDRLLKAGRMQPAGIEKVEAAKLDGRWAAAYAPPSRVTMPDDFQQALDGNQVAKDFFATLNKANIYGVLTRIQFARKAETRAKRIKEFIAMLARGEKLH
jgi:uncharacterized protein YdeI (YjbR/CyaY-like superfamily)